ncbi:MAG: carbon starvation CstA family protein [Verrucomicrobiota bacterium JB025]|nr:carbon starvation protein A [Verrucomicrobiota bacterium JB025]
MTTLIIALGSLVLYLVAYHTYGRWLARRIFQLDPTRTPPSIELEDGNDFVPTSNGVVFGHHFTSIAGTGPIVGPALAVIWGWVPALLWVLFGSIFIGAVHDFGSLVVSMRSKGQTVGDISGRMLAPRTRILFLSVLFLTLTIVLAIFGLVIAAVFRMYPSSIFPCLVQIPVAVVIGLLIHRKGADLTIPSLLALGVMYLTVHFGGWGPLGAFNATLSQWSNLTWCILLLLYSYAASVLPVWVLLQPRDYINSLQLLSALALVILGLVAAALFGFGSGAEKQALVLAAEPIRLGTNAPPGAPMIFPFLFVTIACGAISGFHCLVSSGTSSKQLKSEADARFVGYGSMLTEGFLAVLVILACSAGLGLGIPEIIDGEKTGAILTGADAYHARYATWQSAGGLPAKVGAFVDGAGNFIQALGLPAKFAIALMGVFVASFAATTLDSACRLQRYVTQELAHATGLKPLANKHAATIFAVIIAGVIAALPGAPGKAPGTGGLILWPLFGATNQLLGGLAFLVILFWMWRRNLPVWFVALPALFMLILPATAMVMQLFSGDGAWLTGAHPNYLLGAFGIATLALEAWIVIEAIKAWPKAKGVLELQPE